MKLVSGTRESELAMMQTTYVNKLLTEANPDLEIDVLSMTTKGIVFIIIESTEIHGQLRLTPPLGPHLLKDTKFQPFCVVQGQVRASSGSERTRIQYYSYFI